MSVRRRRLLIRALLRRDGGKCQCGELLLDPFGSDTHVDHRVPVRLGGDDRLSNLQLMHAECNMRKSDGVW